MNGYTEHLEKAKEELSKLRMARWEAVARVYDIEQNITMLERHIGTITTLEEAAANKVEEKDAFPQHTTAIPKKVNGLENKPNG